LKKILLLFLLLSCHAIAQDEINMKDTLNHFEFKENTAVNRSESEYFKGKIKNHRLYQIK
jgi:hypothetical protein